MIERIAKDLIAFAHECRNDSQICGIPGGEDQCGFLLLETSQPGLKSFVDRQVAADQARASSRGMKLFNGRLRRCLDFRMGSEPEIVVAGEVNQPPALVTDLARICLLQRFQKSALVRNLKPL